MEKAETTDTAAARSSLDDVPKAIRTMLSAPYALGEALVQAVAAEDDAAIDRLLENPPPDDSVLLDPIKALGKITPATRVDIPKLATGEKKIDTGQLGSLMTYWMLAERVDLKAALAAADAWDGDAVVSFERDGVVCARVDYSAKGTDSVLGAALDDWATAVGSSARIERRKGLISVESCDPGPDSEVAKDASADALELVATRSYLGSTLIASGLSGKVAGCLTRELLDTYTVENLTDPTFVADDPAVPRRIRALAKSCR